MLTPIIGINDKEKISDIKFGDKVKIIIIKEDEK
jgi:Cu/Ag efflux protein CusF